MSTAAVAGPRFLANLSAAQRILKSETPVMPQPCDTVRTVAGASFAKSLQWKEREMLQEIVGTTDNYGLIALRMRTTEHLVKNYAHKLLVKAGQDSRFGLACFCWREGVLPFPWKASPPKAA